MFKVRYKCVRTCSANRTNTSEFKAKLKRNTVSEKEVDLICKKLDVKHRHFFQLPTGEIIE